MSAMQTPRLYKLILPCAFILCLIFLPAPALAEEAGMRLADQSAQTKKCIQCHEDKNIAPAIVQQWESSRHANNGIGCYECHQAGKGEPDAFEHFETTIATIVSPKDCAKCHDKEVKEFDASHHARAGEILGSLDNVLGEVIEGQPAADSGCKQCHGAKVTVLKGGKLDAATWPNTGIGRLNPDGSKGSCSACHSRHSFSAKLARQPENCGKCHLGPDHPQYEIYNESKHGIAYRSFINEMNLASDSWVLGKDYSAAPTCATCHMSATKDLPLTHDVGTRISWTLRPAISNKLQNWEQRRENMQKVCQTCHAPDYVANFYTQYDDVVGLYNDKFAKPAAAIMKKLAEAGKVTPTQFDDEIEWTYYMLWHHEGRRARHGTAMMGPDYTQWHGFYEVAERFYMHFIPQAEKLLPGATQEFISTHQWYPGFPSSHTDARIDELEKRVWMLERKTEPHLELIEK